MSHNKILSLDLGVTSCGFAVLSETNTNQYQLIDYGIFMRDNPHGDTKSPKAQRSEYISKRKILKKRKNRIRQIKTLLHNYHLYQPQFDEIQNIDIWSLRGKEAYERKLEPYEFFALMRFLAKNRGYKSLKIDDLIKEIMFKQQLKIDCEGNDDIEVPTEIEDFTKTLAYMDALQCKHPDKTLAQIIYKLQENKPVKTFRNHDNYRFMIRRENVRKEIEKIIDTQKVLGLFESTIDHEKLKKEIIEIIIPQNPIRLNPDLINNCSLVKEHKCAPVYAYTYDMFKLYKLINDLRIDDLPATREQKEILTEYVLEKINNRQNISHLSIKEIKKTLNLYNPDTKINNKTEYHIVKGKKELTKLLSFRWFSKLDTFDKEILEEIDTHSDKLDIYDKIATVIQLKIDPNDFLDSVQDIFSHYQIGTNHNDDRIRDFALSLFDQKPKQKGTGEYSFAAIRKLLPLMQEGISESDAIEQLKLGTKSENYLSYPKGIKYFHLSQYEKDENPLSNHTVKSIVSGALRLIKDLHAKYGPFDMIKIESTRELSLPQDAKNAIKKAQDENEKVWNDLKKRYHNHAPQSGLGKTALLKLKLYELQYQRGIYSGKSMGIDDVLSERTEIEHIVPRACGGSSAEYNLVLDFKDENAKKGNRLPLDYLTGEQRIVFIDFVQKLKDEGKINYKKWKNLLAQDLDKTFKEIRDDTSLHATSYAEKLLGTMLKMYYPFEDLTKRKHGTGVMHVSGRATTHLRRILGIANKSRNTNFHHAEDAIILALMSRNYLNRLSRTFRENYNQETKTAKTNLKNIFPTIEGATPAEIIALLRTRYEENLETSPFYKDHQNNTRTVFYWVSKKPIGTQAHNETIQSPTNYAYRVPLKNLFNDIKPAPSHKTKPEKFLDEFNKKVYNRLLIAQENPKDHTAKAIKQRGDEIVSLLTKYQFVTTKEEKQAADKAIRHLFHAPIYDVNGCEIRRVKRIDPKAGGINVGRGIAKVGNSFQCIKFTKLDNAKFQLQKYDIRSPKEKYQCTGAHEMVLYRHDLIDLFVKNKDETELKNSGILGTFFINAANAKYILFNNPKFPLMPQENQPSNYGNKQYAIAKTCGIIKYDVDITGRIKGRYRLGNVIIDGVLKNSNHVIYEPVT